MSSLHSLLFHVGDFEDLAEKRQRFIDDRSLLQKLAPDPGEVISMETHVREVEKIYARLMKGKM